MKYIFTEEQLFTLFAVADIDKIYAFPLEKQLTEEEMINALNELYHRNCIDSNKGPFTLSAELAEIIRTVGCSEDTLQLDFQSDTNSTHLIYPAEDDRLIVLERDTTLFRSAYKIQQTDARSYILDLFENEVLPDSIFDDREEAERAEISVLDETAYEYGENDILLQAKKIRTKTGTVKSKIVVYTTLLFQYIHVQEGDDSSYHLYSAEELVELLFEFLKGDKS